MFLDLKTAARADPGRRQGLANMDLGGKFFAAVAAAALNNDPAGGGPGAGMKTKPARTAALGGLKGAFRHRLSIEDLKFSSS